MTAKPEDQNPPAEPQAAPAEAPAAQDDTKATLEAENASLKDRLLRTLADMENLRRRGEKDLADARQAVEGVLKSVLEGIELTERDLVNTLERHGIKKLDPVGQKFDPNFHQAMMEMQDTTVPSGTVTQVIQTGFAIGERVLRPALVGVAKGGPKIDAAPAAKPH